MDESTILRCSGVFKRYGQLAALDGVSLSVEPGEIFALLGPNGAGKTTLIGCATGLIQDFAGDIRIGGYDVRRDFRVARRLVGLVPQELNFDGFFSAEMALFYQCGYYGIHPDWKRIRQMLKDFSLLEKAKTNTRQLSGGMKRRLMICKALMHEPALLFLDEPTAGVDVDLREELWHYVQRLREEGTTVVLTTHYLEEAERLADRIGIINNGKLLRVQPRESLLAELGRQWLEVRFSGPVQPDDFGCLGAANVYRAGADRLRFEFSSDEKESEAGGEHLIGKVVDRARERGIWVEEVAAGRSSLEEVFRSLVRGVEGNDSEGGAHG